MFLKNILLRGFFVTFFYSASLSLYEWKKYFFDFSACEAYLSVVLIINLIFFLIVWLVSGFVINAIFYHLKKPDNEPFIVCYYLTIFTIFFLTAKSFLYGKKLFAIESLSISILFFSFIFLTLLFLALLIFSYLKRKDFHAAITAVPIYKIVKFLSIVLFILISLYIHNQKLEKVIETVVTNTSTGNKTDRPNIILMTLDTLRADHLSCYGYNRNTSPAIDKIADEGILFEECIATSSWTLPSHTSIFTSLYPTEHRAIYSALDKNKSNVSPELITLAEILKENGYKTAGFIGGPYLSRTFGLNQGFDYYNDFLIPTTADVYFDNIIFMNCLLSIFKKNINVNEFSNFIQYYIYDIWNYVYSESFSKESIGASGWKKKSSVINASLLPWIERNKNSQFFLFINYFDSHAPYIIPKDSNNYYNEGYNTKLKGTIPELEAITSHKYIPTEDDLKYLISLYDSQINYLDMHIKNLFDKLISCEIDKNTIVIITADHGETFGEHNLMQHGFSLYDDNIKVPLIFWGVDTFPNNQKIATPVSIIDIMPTVLDILNIKYPSYKSGESLTPLMAGKNDYKKQYTFSEIFIDKATYRWGKEFKRNLKSLRSGEWKYIISSKGNNELYNIVNDKGETVNLINDNKEMADKMEILTKQLMGSFRFITDGDEESFKINRNIKEKLHGLGYIAD